MLIWFCFVLHESWWINMKYCLIYNLHVMRICLMYLFLSSGKNSGKTLKLAHCSSSSSWRRWRSSAMRRPYSKVASTIQQFCVDRSWSCADPKLWLCFFESTIAGHASTLLWLGFCAGALNLNLYRVRSLLSAGFQNSFHIFILSLHMPSYVFSFIFIIFSNFIKS